MFPLNVWVVLNFNSHRLFYFYYMNKFMWIILSVIAVFALIMSYSFRFKNIETPNYTVLKKVDNVEIRQYPSLILAQTKLKSGRYDGNEDNGFRTVAGYIFGGNQKQVKIAMTAPVIMNMSDSSASMSFVMPSEYQMEDLPKPNSEQVQLQKQDPMILGVLTFGGFASQNKIQKYADELKTVLERNNIGIKGSVLFMGYNAPWDVIGRKNEVAFQITDGYLP